VHRQPPSIQREDALLERNARLVLQLGKLQALWHRENRHLGAPSQCKDPICLKTLTVIERHGLE
jgi:hypothetical protein